MMGCSLRFKKELVLLLFLVAFTASMGLDSSAGSSRKLTKEEEPVLFERETRKLSHKERAISVFHPRILKVKTNDYGSYDPAPALEKPPFKFIPN